MCFERELVVLFEVVPHHPGSFPFLAWGLLAGLPGFASHGRDVVVNHSETVALYGW